MPTTDPASSPPAPTPLPDRIAGRRCKVDAWGVYTNTSPAGSYRAFGASHLQWCGELQVDEIARRCGLDALQIRERNLLHRGESVRPGGKPLDADLIGDIRRVAAGLDWETPKPAGIVGRGMSVGLLAAGAHPVSTAIVRMEADGGATLLVSSTEVGQGARTVFGQIVAEELALPLEQVRVLGGDTRRHALRPLHRRQPLDDARRPRRAARRRRYPRAAPGYRRPRVFDLPEEALTVRAAAVWHEGESVPYPDLIKAHFGMVGGELIGHGEVRPERGSGSYAEGPVFWEVCIGGAEVAVDPETGRVTVHKAVSVADVGKAINPRLVEAQEMGGAMQGIGNALHEEMLFDETGTLLNATLFEYHVPTIADMPDTFVSNIVENADGPGPYGAKGVGEGALAGVAAAIATALADAGVRDRRRYPPRPSASGARWRHAEDRDSVNEGEAMAMKVYLLDNGTLMLDQSFATWNHGQGIEFRFPVYAFFVDHPDGKVMIDTGFDKAWVERKLPFEKPEQSRGPDDRSAIGEDRGEAGRDRHRHQLPPSFRPLLEQQALPAGNVLFFEVRAAARPRARPLGAPRIRSRSGRHAGDEDRAARSRPLRI